MNLKYEGIFSPDLCAVMGKIKKVPFGRKRHLHKLVYLIYWGSLITNESNSTLTGNI